MEKSIDTLSDWLVERSSNEWSSVMVRRRATVTCMCSTPPCLVFIVGYCQTSSSRACPRRRCSCSSDCFCYQFYFRCVAYDCICVNFRENLNTTDRSCYMHCLLLQHKHWIVLTSIIFVFLFFIFFYFFFFCKNYFLFCLLVSLVI